MIPHPLSKIFKRKIKYFIYSINPLFGVIKTSNSKYIYFNKLLTEVSVSKDSSIVVQQDLVLPKFTVFSVSENASVLFGDNICFSNSVTISAPPGTHISIGDNTKVGSKSEIHGDVHIGMDVIISPLFYASSITHKYDKTMSLRDSDSLHGLVSKKVTIGDRSWICRGCHALPGTTVGHNCIIGAYLIIRGNIDSSILYKHEQQYNIKKL